MPLYEYRCDHCGAHEEKLQSMSAPVLHVCPACGAPEGMKRQISRVGLSFQGGGWFAEGYDKGGAPKPAESKPAEAKEAGPKPSGDASAA